MTEMDRLRRCRERRRAAALNSTSVKRIQGHEALLLLMEEYKSLRAEIVASISAQVSILGFGGAIVAIFAAAGTDIGARSAAVSVVIFLAFLPAASYCTIDLWLAEVTRMLRAGGHLRDLEKRVNEQVYLDGEPLLCWENSVHSPGKDDVEAQHLRSVSATFLLFALASSLYALIEADRWLDSTGGKWLDPKGLSLASAFTGAGIFFCWFTLRTRDKYRRADDLRTRRGSNPRIRARRADKL